MQVTNYRNYIKEWMYLERYVNCGSDHKYSHQTEVPPEFRPESPTQRFKLYALDNTFTKEEDFLPRELYPVHPFTAQRYSELGHDLTPTDFEAIPTSSTRTMIVSKDNFKNGFFVKLDLPVKISRFDRSINESDVVFSSQIDSIVKRLHLDSPFAFGIFREIGGGYTPLNDGRVGGYLTRRLKPDWLTSNKPSEFYLIPSFAMVSVDAFNKEDLPLLIQILRLEKNPSRAFFKTILVPLVDFWFSLASQGILWEMQQQNTLFVTDKQHKVIGIAIRDYDGAYIDSAYCIAGKDFIKHTLHGESQRAMRYSLTFDHRVCKQNLIRLIDCFAEYISAEEAQKIKQELTHYIEANLPSSVRKVLPTKKWFTVPEVPTFTEDLDTIVLASPPLRSP